MAAQDRPITRDEPDAVDVAKTPVTDLNIDKREIPAILIEAQRRPYELDDGKRCQALIREIGQLDAILESMPVGEVWISGTPHGTDAYERAMQAIEGSDTTLHDHRAGDSLTVGSIEIDVLHPTTLTGDPAAVAAMEKAYRVYSKKIPLEAGGYTMDHTALVYLMDKQGRFVMPFNMKRKPEDAAADLKRYF